MSNREIIRTDDWVSVSDVAKRAGVSRQAIHQLIESRRLRAMRFGSRSTMVYKRDAETYIQYRKAKRKAS